MKKSPPLEGASRRAETRGRGTRDLVRDMATVRRLGRSRPCCTVRGGGRQLSFARLGAVIAAKERRESIEPKQGLEEAGDSKLEAARATAG